MKRLPVKSSHIKSVGYHAPSRMLSVEFNGGKVYHYNDVSPEAHESLMKAQSVGTHFAEHIKDKYRTVKP